MPKRFDGPMAALLLTVSPLGLGDVDSYAVDPQHTFPVFEVSHYGYSMQRGRFNSVTGSILLNRKASTGSVEIVIDPASIDMGLAEWDEQMRSPDFFDVVRHPRIVFRSDDVRFQDGTPVSASGMLTMLGVTRPVELQITNFACGNNRFSGKPMCGADATAEIVRSEFGMKHLLPGIGDKVRILIAVEATKR